MIRRTVLGTVVMIAFVASLLLCANSLQAQSRNRQIGTSLTATADPVVKRPHTKACVVNLFRDFHFAFFASTFQNFQFAPPANCPGPWSEVVLDIDFNENAGTQFDRTAELYVGNTNLYFGTTPEPIPTAANHWHVEREITDYSALLANPQPGFMELQNCTTDCPAPYNTLLNGVFIVTAQLEFYPINGENPAPRVADMVLPLLQASGSGTNFPAFLFSPTDQYATTFNLPQNTEAAYLDVIAQSQSTDEQWYACFPNDLSAINFFYGCGNTDFRETEVTIDGQPAGLAPVSPWVFTGFLPDQWSPIPAVQTLDFIPVRVNLTPFVGLLNDGNPHTVSLSVSDDDSYFSSAATLLLYLDHDSRQVTGALTRNTLTSPSPVVTENLQGTAEVTGTIEVRQARNYSIAGYANTSHGQVSTSISQRQSFSSKQTIDFNTVDPFGTGPLDQNTLMQTSTGTTTTVVDSQGTTVTQENFSFPITVDIIYPVSNSEFGFTAVTEQNYKASKSVAQNGVVTDYVTTTNAAKSSDVLPQSSSQTYSSSNLNGPPYQCTIQSASNVLTSVTPGCHH